MMICFNEEEDYQLARRAEHLISLHKIFISELSTNSFDDSGREGKCGDCQENDSAWSQCESHKQGEYLKVCALA